MGRKRDSGCERTVGRRRKCQEVGSRALGASRGLVGWRAGLAGKGCERVRRFEGVKWADKEVPPGRVKDLGDFSRTRAGTEAGGWAGGGGLPERGLGCVPPPPLSVTCSKAQLSATRLALRSSSVSGRPRPRTAPAPAPASRSFGPAGQLRLRLAAGGSIGRGRGGACGEGSVRCPFRFAGSRDPYPPPCLSSTRAAPGPPLLPPPQRAGPAG